MQLDRDVLQHVERGAAIAGGDVFDPQHRVGGGLLFLMLDGADRDQRPGIVLTRRLDDLARVAVFHLLAVPEHHDVIRDLCHDGKVMGDVKRGHPGILDRLLDRGQHVDLRCHVQRGRGFVEDYQIGFRAKRHRRHRALQLPAGNLVGIALAETLRIRQAKLAKEHDGALFRLCPAGQAMQERRFDHLLHQLLGRVEGCRGGLGDIGHLMPAQAAQPPGADLEDIAAIDHDLAPGDAHATAPIGHGRQADCGLPGAAFADQAKDLALLHRDRDAVDDGDVLRLFARRIDGRLDLQVADVEQGISHHAPLSGWSCGSAPSPRRD